MTDSLQRFVLAQGQTYETALKEIKSGKKRSHWMWFVFPQLRGLGKSAMSYTYGLDGAAEAAAYLAHPALGVRLRECCAALLKHKGKTAEEIFGRIDAMKLRSSMTLFAAVSDADSVYNEVLAVFYGGNRCDRTLDLLK